MRKIILFICLLFSFTSCVSYESYYRPNKNYLQNRQISTKEFKINDEDVVLQSSVQVLQDLGFIIDDSEKSLGLITASKDRDVNSISRAIGIILLTAISETESVYDIKQKIYVTINITKINNGFINVRTTFARIVWNNLGQSRMEKINDKKIYKLFFDKLEQSLFLVNNNI